MVQFMSMVDEQIAKIVPNSQDGNGVPSGATNQQADTVWDWPAIDAGVDFECNIW